MSIKPTSLRQPQVFGFRADTASAVHLETSPMSDLNVTIAPIQSLEASKDGTSTTSKDKSHVVEKVQDTKSEHKSKAVSVKSTDFSYSVDHEDQSIHLKVKKPDGEVVREVVFDRIDPSLLDLKKLKGVLIDNNA
jgi:environmental stress-induced protein Ves